MAPHFASSSPLSRSSSQPADSSLSATDVSESSSSPEMHERRTAAAAKTISSSSSQSSSTQSRPAPNRVLSMPQMLRTHSKASTEQQPPSTAPLSSSSSASSASASSSTRSRQPPRYARSYTGSTGLNSSSNAQWSAAKVLDRGLLRRFDDVNTELAQLARLSTQLDAPAPAAANLELERVTTELERMQQSASAVLTAQKELQDKIARHERTPLRRFFAFQRDQRAERLKRQLCAKMAESLEIDAAVELLERKSDSLLTDWRASLFASSLPLDSSGDADTDLATRIATLEREKQDLLCELLSAVRVPEAAQLQSRIALCASEARAAASVKRQVDKVTTLYRRALTLLRAALAEIVADDYTGSVLAFTTGPFANAVEAGQLIEAARTHVQPESQRRYRAFASAIVDVDVPRFPPALGDFARRTRTHFDPHSGLAIDATRKLETGEHVILLMHRLVLEKLDVLDKWNRAVESDQDRATREQTRLETKLQQRMAVAARSISV